jgi:hypothetical protein
MTELNGPLCTENGNGIEQPDSLSFRAVSRSAGDLERYKERVWQLYAHHSVKQVCEILKKEDRIIVRYLALPLISEIPSRIRMSIFLTLFPAAKCCVEPYNSGEQSKPLKASIKNT